MVDLEPGGTESASEVRARIFEQDLACNMVRIEDRDLTYKNAMCNAIRREEGSAREAGPRLVEARECSGSRVCVTEDQDIGRIGLI